MRLRLPSFVVGAWYRAPHGPWHSHYRIVRCAGVPYGFRESFRAQAIVRPHDPSYFHCRVVRSAGVPYGFRESFRAQAIVRPHGPPYFHAGLYAVQAYCMAFMHSLAPNDPPHFHCRGARRRYAARLSCMVWRSSRPVFWQHTAWESKTLRPDRPCRAAYSNPRMVRSAGNV